MRSIFVTGGARLISSHTCLLLLEKGYTVFKLDTFVNLCEESILNWIPKRNIDDIFRDGWNWQLKNPYGFRN